MSSPHDRFGSKSVKLRTSKCFPVRPRQQTWASGCGASDSGQEPTPAAQQNIALSFKQCVGTKQERFRDREAQGLCSSEIDS
jgi:hypothetical protein